jgi:AraC-like DNA-binding protein
MKDKSTKRSSVKSRSFLLTLITSLLILICIPVIVFQLVLVRQSTNEISKRNTEYYNSVLHNCSVSYNEQIELLRYHALNISLDHRMAKPLKNDCTAYEIFEAAQAIDSYGQGLLSVAKVGLYYPSQQYVLIDGYQRTMDVFFEALRIKNADEQRQLTQRMMDAEQRDAFYINGTLILARPVHLLSQFDYDGSVFFLIDIADFGRIFEANLPADAEVAVRNADDWILHSELLKNALETETSLQNFVNSEHNGMHVLHGEAQMHTIYKYIDKETNNGYFAVIETKQAEKSLTDYRNRITGILAVSMVLLCAMAIIMVYINYKPIKKLVIKHTDSGRGELSELERLDSAFFARDEKISDQRSLLGSLLLGDLISGADEKADMSDQDFGYRNLRYFAVVTVAANDLNVKQAYTIAEKLQDRMETMKVYTTSIPNRAHVLFVFMDEAPINIALIKADVILTIHEITGQEREVKVGDVVQRFEDIRRSYYTSFMDYQKVMESEEGFSGEVYPAQDVQHFVQCVCAGNESGALVMLDKIDAYYAVRKYRTAHKQYYDYKLLSAYLGGLKENAIDISGEEIDELLAFNNHEELFALLRKSVKGCCGRMISAAEQTSLILQSKLVQYVNNNLTNVEMCLSSAAEEFNTSIYVVSRLFKEATGAGFKEYVINKRLELSREMLLTSDESVTNIAKTCGFENLTYFSTAFRKCYGQAPSKFRNLYKMQEE